MRTPVILLLVLGMAACEAPDTTLTEVERSGLDDQPMAAWHAALPGNPSSSKTSAPQVGPLYKAGDIDGAPYQITVPATWNGTLVVYCPGMRDKADGPGEVDDRNAYLGPSWPTVLALYYEGYAIAATSYKDNGWSVYEAIQDVRNLVSYFRDTIARPERTILWGLSMGTVVAVKNLEQAAGLFDGAVICCSVGAGTTRTWDAWGDFALAYHTVFGIPPAWGTAGDVRDDVDFDTEVIAKLSGELSDTANFPKFEFLRLVLGTPWRGIDPPVSPSFFPGWAFPNMYFAFEARAELERRAAGPVFQNIGRTYSLTPAEVGYLNGLGVESSAIEGWLASMNGQRYAAPPYARNYLRQNADLTGKIKHPVLSVHTVVDQIIMVSQEYELAQTVQGAGRGDLLFQTYTDGSGHCAFTDEQYVTAVRAINEWVKTGVSPSETTFPASLGFVPGYVPPPMDQP